MTNARQKWNLPVNCKHLDEPWIFHPMKSVTKFPTEHIGLRRPTCPKCINWCSEFNDMIFQKHLDIEGRKMKIISPTSVTFEGVRGLSKNVDGKAMYESKIDNNFFFNLALSKENEYEICFEKTSE